MSNLGNRNRLNHALRTDEGNEGAAVVLNNEITASIRATEALGKNQTTRNDFNNRLTKMIKWVRDKIQSGAIIANENELVRELSESEKNDTINYHKSIHDFKYENLPSSIVKSFMSDPNQKYKKRRNENDPLRQYGFDNSRKYHDAILFGANRARKRLTTVMVKT